MSIIGINSASAVKFHSSQSDARTSRDFSPNTATAAAAARQREFLQVSGFRHLLRQFAPELTGIVRGSSTASRPPLISAAPLTLNNTPTFTAVESVDQVNATTTAWSPTQPSFSGSSSVTPTMSGIYTGSTDDVYTFRVTDSGFLGGLFSQELEVRNQAGDLIKTITVPAFYSSGTKLDVANGLKVAFSGSYFSSNDTFQVSVFGNVDNKVQADNAFNGTGVNGPAFDHGVSVTAGAFTVNGQSVNVLASDSVNSVLQKISESAAGVTATFDSVRERVIIESNTAGSAGTIVFGGDTSGFLAAVKLDTATVVSGIDEDLRRRMVDVVSLQSIQAGTFSLNGTTLSNDPNVDTLQEVLDRINGSDAGVHVRYEQNSDRIRLTPGHSLDSLQLGDGTSSLFSQLGLSTELQEYVRPETDSGASLRKLTKAVNEFADQLNGLVEAADSRELESVLRKVFGDSFRDLKGSQTVNATHGLRALGLDLDAGSGDAFLTINESALKSALRQQGRTFQKLLHGSHSRAPGLLADLDQALGQRLQELQLSAASSGSGLVDFRA